MASTPTYLDPYTGMYGMDAPDPLAETDEEDLDAVDRVAANTLLHNPEIAARMAVAQHRATERQTAPVSLSRPIRWPEPPVRFDNPYPRQEHGEFGPKDGSGAAGLATQPSASDPTGPGRYDDYGGGLSEPVKTYINLAADRAKAADWKSEPFRQSLSDLGAGKDAIRQANAVDLAQAAGVTKGVAFAFQDAWSQSSNSMEALLMEQAATKQFGVPPFDDPNAQKEYASRMASLAEARSQAKTDPGPYSDKFTREDAGAAAFVQAQYAATQRWYEEHPEASHEGPDGQRYVTLYRGMVFPADQVPDELATIRRDRHVDVEVESFPLSAWSISANRASAFSFGSGGGPRRGYLMSAEVPVGRIFGNGITGVGAMREGEHVVIGGRMRVRAWMVKA